MQITIKQIHKGAENVYMKHQTWMAMSSCGTGVLLSQHIQSSVFEQDAQNSYFVTLKVFLFSFGVFFAWLQ